MSIPPSTTKKPVTEHIHHHTIQDDYRWLEDDHNPEVDQWITEQNQYTKTVLAQDQKHQQWEKELKECFNVTVRGIPRQMSNKIFWQEKRPGQNQPVVYVKNTLLDETTEVIINPNELINEGLISLDYWAPSPNGNYLNYGLSQNGDEMATMYIYNLQTHQLLSENIPNARYSIISWLSDESGFFYTSHPQTGSVPEEEQRYRYYIYFHKVGSPVEQDQVIWGPERPKTEMITFCELSDDDQDLVFGCAENWTKTEVHLYHRRDHKTQPVLVGYEAAFDGFIKNHRLYIRTNHQAEHGKVIACDLKQIPTTIAQWQTIIHESADQLQRVGCSSEKLIAMYLKDVSSLVNLFNLDGTSLETLSIPSLSSVTDITTTPKQSTFFLGVQNFLHDNEIYYFDGNTLNLYQAAESQLSSDEFISKQIWYTSKDGTQVPMFIVHHKSLTINNNTPTLLYAYGGFGQIITPFFPRRQLPFLKQGGVLAVANIRGGGELGKSWHQDGILTKKTNSFHDFAAAAEYLQQEGYTNSRKLVIQGGSNGGLLVAATAMLYPHLFQGVISQVPLTDMVRFPQFLIAERWTHEYGNPQKAEDLERILQWSPYHNVKPHTHYPHFLFTTARHDTRVAPLHAFKMAALLQCQNPACYTLLRTEYQAGHGIGKGTQQLIEEQADILSFINLVTKETR